MRVFLTMAFACLISAAAFGQEMFYKHQVSFGANYNLGWDASGALSETDDNVLDSFEEATSNLKLNYFHTLTPYFQLGISLTGDSLDQTQEGANGQDVDISQTKQTLYILGTYNFTQIFSTSWYIGGGVGKEWINSETDRTPGVSTDNDYELTGILLYVGKRISLSGVGIENLTYSPMVTFSTQTTNGDLEDSGVDSIRRVRFDIIKFDLLF